MSTTTPTIDAVRAARERIAGRVHRTPVLTSRAADDAVGARVFFKCENFQKVGAFKARGAVNAVFSLEDPERGVVAHSSGNHAAALAYAASLRGVPCTVVMPDTTPAVKVDAVRGYGAEIVFCKPGERESTCDRVQRESGATFIHPNADPRVIAGQGTAALELLDEVEDLDVVMTPVGGGGLLSGTAIVVRAVRPEADVVGAEPAAADDAYRSLQTGVLQPRVDTPDSIADGLLTGLGELNFHILSEHNVTIVTVDEAAIAAAARFHLERMKIVVEPSGATVLAALTVHRERFAGCRVGAVISGGNTDFSWLR